MLCYTCKLYLLCFQLDTVTQVAKLKKVKADQENLPIYKFKDAMIDLVRQHQVVVIAGDTGCGKSTQVMQHSHTTSVGHRQYKTFAKISYCYLNRPSYII